MNDRIKESDWKQFKKLRPLALQRYCKRVIQEVRQVLDEEVQDAHEQYLKMYKKVDEGDRKLAKLFDGGFSRSKAFIHLLMFYREDLIKDDELRRLSDENYSRIKSIVDGGSE